MTQTQSTRAIALLNAWMTGSALADDLLTQTEALLAQLAAKPTKAACQTIDTAEMTESQVFAYYKRIAPREDMRAFLSHPLSDALRAEGEALLAQIEAQGGKHTAQTKRAYVLLQQHWRQADNAARVKTLTPQKESLPVFYRDTKGSIYNKGKRGMLRYVGTASSSAMGNCVIRPVKSYQRFEPKTPHYCKGEGCRVCGGTAKAVAA